MIGCRKVLQTKIALVPFVMSTIAKGSNRPFRASGRSDGESNAIALERSLQYKDTTVDSLGVMWMAALTISFLERGRVLMVFKSKSGESSALAMTLSYVTYSLQNAYSLVRRQPVLHVVVVWVVENRRVLVVRPSCDS